MPNLTVRLPDATLASWRAHCAARGLKPTAAIREAIEQQVGQDHVRVSAPGKQAPVPGGRNKVRVSIWLTESEREAIRLRTTLHGGSRAGWVIRVIRAALTREPQFGDIELEALGESSYQLLSIGRNLNQIARRLNEHQKQQPVELAMIEALRDQIDQHVTKVDRAIRASTERWGIE